MPRLKGNNTPVFSLKTATGSVIDFGADLVSVEFTDGDGVTTMGDKATGIRPVQLNATFALDSAASALFEYANTNAGATGVTYVVQLSSATVSQTNPKWTGTLTMPARPVFSAEVGDGALTFDFSAQTDTYAKAIV